MKTYAITQKGTGDVMEIVGVVVSGVMCRMPALFHDKKEAGRVLAAIQASGYSGGPWQVESLNTTRDVRPVRRLSGQAG